MRRRMTRSHGVDDFPRRQTARAGVSILEALERRMLLAAGDLDPTFGLGGSVEVSLHPSLDYGVGSVDVANGRIVVGGAINPRSDPGEPEPHVALAVLDLDGNLVESFGDGGIINEPRVPGGVIGLVVEPDNQIVVATSANLLTRFNADGSLDTAFGQKPFSFSWRETSVAVAGNGDVVIGGSGSNGSVIVQRYSSDGAFIGEFTLPPESEDRPRDLRDLAVDADNNVVIVGRVIVHPVPEASPSEAGGFAARIKADLSGLDPAFSGDGVFVFPNPVNDAASAKNVAIDAQGRILVGLSDWGREAFVYRLLASGEMDPGFAESMLTVSDSFLLDLEDLSVATDGAITISGNRPGGTWFLARFNPDGGLDTSFGGGDGDTTPIGPDHDVQADGRIVVVGRAPLDRDRYLVQRHRVDNTFDTGQATLGSDGVLRITGSVGNDDVVIDDDGTEIPTEAIRVTLNGRLFDFPGDQVSRIEVATQAGNDRVANGRYTTDDPGQRPRLLNGGDGDDELHGGSGNDYLLGMAGNDTLFGNDGDDRVDGGQGTDVQMGGSGADTIDYSFRSAVHVDLEGDADDGPPGEGDTVGTDVEHIHGGRGNDTLVGNDLPNFIRGNGGDDTIHGGGGNDALHGDAGQDSLFGEAGDDYLDAVDGIADLVLDGGPGFDGAVKDDSDPHTNIEQINDAPTVTGVFVAGTAWSDNFHSFLGGSGAGEAGFGYRVLATQQTDELPWINLDQVSIRFSEPVNVAANDLIVRGVNVGIYAPAAVDAFAYDAATFTATWTLAESIAADKLLLDLHADTGTGVTDLDGNALDGEWNNPVAPDVSGDTFPSGDGSARGDFHFRMNVLPGDVNRSGGILGNDVTSVRVSQGAAPGSAPYTIFKDVNGSGSILGNDVTAVRVRQGIALPPREPSAKVVQLEFFSAAQGDQPEVEFIVQLDGGTGRTEGIPARLHVFDVFTRATLRVDDMLMWQREGLTDSHIGADEGISFVELEAFGVTAEFNSRGEDGPFIYDRTDGHPPPPYSPSDVHLALATGVFYPEAFYPYFLPSFIRFDDTEVQLTQLTISRQ